jgi:hypothetical protein
MYIYFNKKNFIHYLNFTKLINDLKVQNALGPLKKIVPSVPQHFYCRAIHVSRRIIVIMDFSMMLLINYVNHVCHLVKIAKE